MLNLYHDRLLNNEIKDVWIKDDCVWNIQDYWSETIDKNSEKKFKPDAW